MISYSLKPFDKGNYLSEEESLKLIEKIPIPKNDASSESANPTKAKSGTSEANNPLSGNNPVVDLEGRLIDLNPADNGNEKTQDDWIAYFNDRNEIMVSMPDLYLAGKSNNQTFLTNLRKDLGESWMYTSTRVQYKNKTDTRIIHYYKSKLITPIEYKIATSECKPILLAGVLNTKDGLEFLQALFGTKDNIKQIKDTLHKLSNYPLDVIKVWGTRLSDETTDSAPCFYSSYGFFNICSSTINWHGISRGMRLITPGVTQLKGGVK